MIERCVKGCSVLGCGEIEVGEVILGGGGRVGGTVSRGGRSVVLTGKNATRPLFVCSSQALMDKLVRLVTRRVCSFVKVD